MEPPVGPPSLAATGPSYEDDRFARAMDELTPVQRRAVDAASPALCIVAGAGSGKTRVLTLRTARRIRDGATEADHTVVCTFTRKAATELRERLLGYGVPVSTPTGAKRIPSSGVRVGTIHQLALTLLRRRAADSGQPPPALIDHRWRVLAELTGDRATANAADTEIGWAKARCVSPSQYGDAATAGSRSTALPADRVIEIFDAYEERLKRRRLLDLDDVLLHAADLLLADDRFAEQVRWRYRHVAVDEFQDVNPAQFRLLEAVVGDRLDLCVVGDPNQAIYGWNGSEPSLLTAVVDVVPGIEVVHLDQNHRCTPEVVITAAAALGPSDVPPPASAAPPGPRPSLTAYDDDQAEAEGVAAAIVAGVEHGAALSDHAVLARTHDQLSVVRRALERAGVPHRFTPAPQSDERTGPVVSSGRSGARPLRSNGSEGEGGAVDLATFHRAKGLEWHSVYAVGLEEGLVPIVYATTAAQQAEERRLLYVALTRARSNLACSWARRRSMANGREMERVPSPRLAEMEPTCVPGLTRPPSTAAANRFAELRANLRG